jgi:hypothetical protein
MRTFVSAAIALVLCVNVAPAADKADKKATKVSGVVKKVDAEKGVITVTVKKSKTETEDKEFKVEEATKFVFLGEAQKKELSSKEGIKDPTLKEGAPIVLTVEDGKVTSIQVGKAKKGSK